MENELQVGFAGVENQSEELKKKLYDDQYKLFMDDRYTIGSDTIPAGMLCHPRGFGSFARIIAYMRERNVPVEYIVKKLTSMPVEMYRLEGRGVLKAGMKADICLMDYENVKDQATFEDPRQRATGVEALYINGLPALEHGNITGILAGLSHTFSAVIGYRVRCDRTLLTGCPNDLDHVSGIFAAGRALALCQADTLTDDLALFINTAAELCLRSRYDGVRNLSLVFLIQLAVPCKLCYLVKYVVFDA